MKKPNVLVLMATYNGDRWLSEQIHTVIHQSNVNVKLLISDDGSTDNTIAQLKLFHKNYKNLEILNAGISGSAGLNFQKLIDNADLTNVDYVAFSDQDDIWALDKLSRAVSRLGSNSYFGYSSSVRAVWNNGKTKTLNQSSCLRKADFLFEGAGQGCTFVIPVELFRKVQKFCRDHKDLISKFYYHDWLVYLLTRSWGGGWIFDEKITLDYRQHAVNDTGSRGTFSAIYKRLDKIRSGWYKQQVRLALDIYFFASMGTDITVSDFAVLFKNRDSLGRRYFLAKFFFQHGRRRVSDRFIMIMAGLAGYL